MSAAFRAANPGIALHPRLPGAIICTWTSDHQLNHWPKMAAAIANKVTGPSNRLAFGHISSATRANSPSSSSQAGLPSDGEPKPP